MKRRTQEMALRVIRLVRALPRGPVAEVLGRQVLRSATSVGANYRAACRSRSDADFLARMGIVEEECDETLYWMELLVSAGLVKENLLGPLGQECDEILSIVVASIKTVKGRRKKPADRQSEVPNPKSEIPNPQSPIRNPQSQSEIPNPKSEIGS